MKIILTAALFFAVILVSCGDKDEVYSGKELDKPKKQMDQVSYSIGLNIGKQMRNDSLKPNVDYIALGIYHGLKKDSADFLMSQAEIDSAQKRFGDEMTKNRETKMKKEQEELVKKGETNKVEGQRFLEENKKKSGVTVTPSGLQYEVLTPGTGKKPQPGEMVKVHLVARYTDGKEFDNTYKRAPISLPYTEQIIPGWREALSLMKTGAKYRFVIPPQLGWGEMGMPPTIPPNSVLVFEIELLSIEDKAGQPQGMPPGPGPQPMQPR